MKEFKFKMVLNGKPVEMKSTLAMLASLTQMAMIGAATVEHLTILRA